MMDAAERHCKLVARLAAERAPHTGGRAAGRQIEGAPCCGSAGALTLSTLLSIRLDGLVLAPSCAPISTTRSRSGGKIDYRRLSDFGCWELGDLLFKASSSS